MTLEQIKNEITDSIKDVRARSADFINCESYDDLQSLFKKAIGRVALCESADDLEAVGDLLLAIEELFNDCNSEFLNQECDEELFTFDFELDDDPEAGPDGESDVEDEIVDEDEYIEDEPDDDDAEYQEELLAKEEAARKAKEEKRRDSKLLRDKKYAEAKAFFDKKYTPDRMKKPNTWRLCLGLVFVLTGVGLGLIEAQWWPWIWQAWATVGVGISLLLLCVIYAIASKSRKTATVRKMCVARLVLAAAAAVLSLIFGIFLEDSLTLAGAFIATLPFTILGLTTYLTYRMRLWLIIAKLKKLQKKKGKKTA